MDITGKIALVVGGGGGIGRAIGKALADEGCKVALSDCDEQALRKAAESAGSKSPLPWRTCDITDRGQVAQLFQWIAQELGTVEILVNSAGINISNRMMANVDPVDFDRVMAVNFTGGFNLIHAALPGMREKRSGLIFNIVSVAGKRVMPIAGLPYCTSKFALSTLGTFVNLEECEKNGIRVTNIYPGEANTPLVDKRPVPPPPEKRARMLQPEDIAACVVAVAKLPPRAVVQELVIAPAHMLID
jgi:NAD(P)-dependent dehydrogenase (short-subunit alcohol dehydrogenase family)